MFCEVYKQNIINGIYTVQLGCPTVTFCFSMQRRALMANYKQHKKENEPDSLLELSRCDISTSASNHTHNNYPLNLTTPLVLYNCWLWLA